MNITQQIQAQLTTNEVATIIGEYALMELKALGIQVSTTLKDVEVTFNKDDSVSITIKSAPPKRKRSIIKADAEAMSGDTLALLSGEVVTKKDTIPKARVIKDMTLEDIELLVDTSKWSKQDLALLAKRKADLTPIIPKALKEASKKATEDKASKTIAKLADIKSKEGKDKNTSKSVAELKKVLDAPKNNFTMGAGNANNNPFMAV